MSNLFKFWKSYFFDQFTLHFGGGGGGGTTQTTSTVQNTNIPDYAKGYVENMLGATQKQLFNTSPVQTGTDDQGNPIMGTSLDSFKPYQAYGGTYDAQGNQLSYDPSKAVAGFSPMQQAAQQGIANMQTPGQFTAGSAYANQAGSGGLNSAAQALGYGAQGNFYGGVGLNAGLSGQLAGAQGQAIGGAGGQLGIQGGARYGSMGAAAGQEGQNIGTAGGAQYGAQGAAAGQAGQNLGIVGGEKYGQQGVAAGQAGQNIGIIGGAQYGAQGAGYGQGAASLANPALAYGAQGAGYGQQGAGFGQLGAGYGQQAANLANTALYYGQGSADIGKMALQAQATGQGITAQSQELARQQALAGQNYAQMATDPNSIQKYMNPYTQNVVDVQNKELQRQADIAGTQRGATAARSGAFGGSRQAIENAEANRNLAMLKNQNQAQGLQQAYKDAQTAQQYGAGLGLQGQTAAQTGLNTALQGGQLGLSGLGTALQGQQGALAGVGQAGSMYGLGMQGAQTGIQGAGMGLQGTQAGLAGINAANQSYQTGIQGAGMGLQGVNAQLAGTAQGMQGAGMGLQGVNTQLAGTAQGMQGAGMGLQGVNTQLAGTAQGMQGAQIGLQGVNTQLAGVDRQLAGTAQGMQGAQIGIQGAQAGMQGAGMGLQGVQGAQAGYGLANQAGANLANIGAQQQAAQLGIYGAQNTAGAQQQQLEQAKINQSMLDYANAQQYPLMQLGTMSNMLRGLPMQASTTNQYAASPNPMSQAIGAIGAGTSIYNAYNPKPGGAAGGLPSEFKYSKGGGIMSYDMGGEVESQLENMGDEELARQAKESSSPTIRKMAQRVLRGREISKQAGNAGAEGVQYQASAVPGLRGGGIIAFKTGGGANEEGGEDEAKIDMAERLAQPAPTTGGIMGATTQPTTPIPVVPAGPSPDVVQEAMRQRDLASAKAARPTADLLKEIQAEREALGVGENVARQEYRSQIMAERANMADEKERQRHMRLAEFFASWGSTPGPVLVAGMNALKQSVPNIISDEKEQKKARREADKIIYDIDEATRLEKLGMIDKATAIKEQAAKHAEDYNKYLLTFQSQRESDKRALEQTAMTTEAQRDVANINARTQGGVNAQRAEEMRLANIDRALGIARNRLADIEKDIESTRSKPPKGTPLAKAMESVSRYNSMLASNKDDPTKVPDYIRKDAEQAQEVVNRFEDSAKRRLKEARDQVRTYENIFTTQGRASKSGAEAPAPAMSDNPLDLDLSASADSAAPAAPANAPTKTSTSRTGDASSVNPYVDTKGKARPDAPRGEPSKASKLIDQATPVIKETANKVVNELSGSEQRYLKDKIARNEKLSVTDRIRAERAGLL